MKNQFPLKLRDYLTIQIEKCSSQLTGPFSLDSEATSTVDRADILTNSSPTWTINYLRTKSDCNATAVKIITLLGDQSQMRTENTFEDKEYKKSSIINELFKNAPPDENNETYSLFQITHCYDDWYLNHAYVIEKGWNANKNAYDYWIHHSSNERFTLAQWEGTDDSWTSSLVLWNDPIIKWYDQFRGKQLTSAGIEKFINHEITSHEKPKKMRASMYVIDNQKIQQLEACLEAQSAGDQKQEKGIVKSQFPSFISTYKSRSFSNERTQSDTIIPATSSRLEYDSLALRQCGLFSKMNFGASALEIFKQMYITLSQVMPLYPPFLHENLITKPNNKM